MTLVSLRSDRLGLDLAPSAGGSIARFRVDGRDILRPMAEADIASGKGNNAAAYPLVPFSNRIADGRLAFAGEEIALEPNWPGQSHPMHGDGWARAWEVAQSGSRSAELVYVHDGQSGWPFRYRARQGFLLEDDRLEVRMSLENLETRDVPAGLGLHPFFVRDRDCELHCTTTAVWHVDAEVLPIKRTAVPVTWDFCASRRVDSVVLDNCFEGWDGHAEIVWPSRGLKLSIEASEPFRHLVIFIPPGRPYFCVEPVSHASGRLGATRLAAGATLEGTIVFRLSNL